MGLVGAIFTAVLFFLQGIAIKGWATVSPDFLGWCYVITAVVIIVELAWPRFNVSRP